LHQDISVAKLALDNEKSNFPKTARLIQRKEIARDGMLPDKLKIGRFSKKEDSVIIQNWQELLKKANLENQSIETIQNSVFNPSNISKENQNQAEIQMIKNLIGYWLSIGLTHTRLSCEVFQRLNVLSNTTGGEFSAEEDKLVIQYVQQNGRKWKELSKMTGRPIPAILSRYDSFLLPSLQNGKLKKGNYSIENDLQIMAAVLKHNPKCPVGRTRPPVLAPLREYKFKAIKEEKAPEAAAGSEEAAKALGKDAYFTPHMYIYDGVKTHCLNNDGENFCYNLCTNNGRYCATDPDNDLDQGISGQDVVKESLRRLCIWAHYGHCDGFRGWCLSHCADL